MECLTIDTKRSSRKLSLGELGKKEMLQSKDLFACNDPRVKEIGKKVDWDSYTAQTQYSRNI